MRINEKERFQFHFNLKLSQVKSFKYFAISNETSTNEKLSGWNCANKKGIPYLKLLVLSAKIFWIFCQIKEFISIKVS